MKTVCRSRWFLPSFALALGGVFLVVQTIGGRFADGLVSLGIMAVFASVFVFGGRSETLRALRGDGRDERFDQIDVRATAFAGTVVIVAIIVAFTVSLAQGHDGGPYTWLGVIAGLAYLGAIVALRVRG